MWKHSRAHFLFHGGVNGGWRIDGHAVSTLAFAVHLSIAFIDVTAELFSMLEASSVITRLAGPVSGN